MTLSQDGTPFGFQLTGVDSSLTGATVTGPSGSPPSISVDLGSNPNPGDSIQFQLTLPDGSTQTISLQATTNSPPGANQFTIGTLPSDTATNLQTALTTAITGLTQTALPAASAMAAANDFFGSNPPLRVNGSPPDTSTALVNGTAANTVFWYTGENGSTPARQTATAQVGPTMTIDYGMRANEQALTTLVANVAVLAATTYSASDPNAQANYQALSQRGCGEPRRPAGHPDSQRYRSRSRQCADHRQQCRHAEHANANDIAGHVAEYRRRESEPDRRGYSDLAEQPVGVDVGHGAARAIEPGQLSRAGHGLSRAKRPTGVLTKIESAAQVALRPKLSVKRVSTR